MFGQFTHHNHRSLHLVNLVKMKTWKLVRSFETVYVLVERMQIRKLSALPKIEMHTTDLLARFPRFS